MQVHGCTGATNQKSAKRWNQVERNIKDIWSLFCIDRRQSCCVFYFWSRAQLPHNGELLRQAVTNTVTLMAERSACPNFSVVPIQMATAAVCLCTPGDVWWFIYPPKKSHFSSAKANEGWQTLAKPEAMVSTWKNKIFLRQHFSSHVFEGKTHNVVAEPVPSNCMWKVVTFFDLDLEALKKESSDLSV